MSAATRPNPFTGRPGMGFSRLADLSDAEKDRLAEAIAKNVNARTRPVRYRCMWSPDADRIGKACVFMPGDPVPHWKEED